MLFFGRESLESEKRYEDPESEDSNDGHSSYGEEEIVSDSNKPRKTSPAIGALSAMAVTERKMSTAFQTHGNQRDNGTCAAKPMSMSPAHVSASALATAPGSAHSSKFTSAVIGHAARAVSRALGHL